MIMYRGGHGGVPNGACVPSVDTRARIDIDLPWGARWVKPMNQRRSIVYRHDLKKYVIHRSAPQRENGVRIKTSSCLTMSAESSKNDDIEDSISVDPTDSWHVSHRTVSEWEEVATSRLARLLRALCRLTMNKNEMSVRSVCPSADVNAKAPITLLAPQVERSPNRVALAEIGRNAVFIKRMKLWPKLSQDLYG